MSQHGDGKRTKNIYTRYNFFREYVEDGTVLITFVKSENNLADPYTKNVTESVFSKMY